VACLLEAVAVKTLDKQKMKHLKAAAPSGGDSWFLSAPSLPGLVLPILLMVQKSQGPPVERKAVYPIIYRVL